MPAIKTENLISAQAFGALLSLFLFFLIGGCGGGTMGTQTGEQRVAVVGTVVDARGGALADVTVEILDDSGQKIGSATTGSGGTYAIEVLTAGLAIIVQFTTPGGSTAAAAVAVSSSTSVMVNAVVGPNVITPIVPTPVPTANPTPTTSQGGGGVPTTTPVPTPGATNTPTPIAATPSPTPTQGLPPPVYTADPGPDACEQKGVDLDECCNKSSGLAGVCCSPELLAEGSCSCEVLDGYNFRCVP